MNNSAYCYFENSMTNIESALKTLSRNDFDKIVFDCVSTIRNGHKIIVSGLGKNAPICEKFVMTMISLGLDANFLNTNSALHGDMGMIHSGDLVIIVTKSGTTSESVELANLIRERGGVKLWLLTFCQHSPLTKIIENRLVLHLDDEGDLWNIIPNNSSTINLVILQTLAVHVAEKLNLDLERNFKPNHPGGAIGEMLYNGNN